MIATVDVGLNLRRPVREDFVVRVMVAVDVTDFDFFAAEQDARLFATEMAMSVDVPAMEAHWTITADSPFKSPTVPTHAIEAVMPVWSRIISIDEI